MFPSSNTAGAALWRREPKKQRTFTPNVTVWVDLLWRTRPQFPPLPNWMCLLSSMWEEGMLVRPTQAASSSKSKSILSPYRALLYQQRRPTGAFSIHPPSKQPLCPPIPTTTPAAASAVLPKPAPSILVSSRHSPTEHHDQQQHIVVLVLRPVPGASITIACPKTSTSFAFLQLNSISNHAKAWMFYC